MPRLTYALICTDEIVDKETSAVSFIRVAEVVHFARLPGQVPPLVLALAFERGPEGDTGAFNLRLSRMGPDGALSPLIIFTVPSAPGPNQRVSLRLAGMTVTKPGRYAVLVEVEDEGKYLQLAELPLHVVLRAASRSPGAVEAPEGPVQ